MKNIVFFNLDMNIGGVERQLYYLLSALKVDDRRIELLLCKKEGDFLKKIPQHILVHSLDLYYSKAAKLLIGIKLFLFLIKNRPSLFVCFHTQLTSISAFVCFILRIRNICCFSGYFPPGRLNFLRQALLRSVDRVIAVSDGVRNSLVDSLGLVKASILVIPNAIDVQEIDRLSKESVTFDFFKNNYPVIVSLGRLAPKKGFDAFIKAIPLVKTKCNYLIIGDGSEKSRLERLAIDLEITKKIHFLGSTPNPYKYLSRSTIFVLASESEGLPTVILEAKALRIPCICSDYLGGTSGVVENNSDGIVFPRNHTNELASAIDYLLNNRSVCQMFVERGYQQVTTFFGINEYAKKYEQLFQDFRL